MSLPSEIAVSATAEALLDQPRSRFARSLLAICAGLLFLCFLGLGSWQVQRLSWKLQLIERVTQRVHAPALAAPEPAEWPQISAASHEYLHVNVRGKLLPQYTSLSLASTELGGGFWVMTPLRDAGGRTFFINRGFIPSAGAQQFLADQRQQPEQPAVVLGLLRLSEPGGGFLRHNDARAERWFSRDVAALASFHGLSAVAPFFIDADRSTAAAALVSEPVAGLTVIHFHNNHLVYALTWYALAAMVAAGYLFVARADRRLRRQQGGSAHETIDS
ncbi:MULTISPECIES: SURF1 family protein [unclassified Undibacterium]|uniref:SURF1 family protein n=1 Tax=unclassified Undibacterium TaxID=2630295 RepID=UPI002AC9D78E|nr:MULTISPECIES: SURF1 family protein [unclassified Undibacterium]MEB0140229.1 SURF1 family protein [Undibacterium sp. CCC2.1]MEB0173232.1 SURF1 family protein [Undibacterium sp. CCC1.1]MEB0177079.1 SURF1 family protein [Undibacterium sp. CCC3.4]MEB0216340.1 SURF1 family protein [Undibacterium sp. 5I2]WPX45194.1 SURF1 family protein [Undibacterium sp. CCC3.4]